jgi:hypothetical protein
VICRIVISLEPSIVREAVLKELRTREQFCIYECDPSECDAIPHEFDVAGQLRRILLASDAPEDADRCRDCVDDAAYVATDDPAAMGRHGICVITAIESADVVPPDIARWVTEFPEVVVIGIDAVSGKILRFRQTIEVVESGDSLSDLVNTVGRMTEAADASTAWRKQ